MSKINLTPNASGTGVFTIASPNSNTDRTLNLPDEAGEFVLSASGVISNFTSTGIDDNATSTAITIDASENVGIGTASPQKRLHISGPSGGDAGISFTNSISGESSTDGLLVTLNSDGTNATFWNYENGYMRFATNSTERMRITSNGNVGIGNSSPNSGFDVSLGSLTVPAAGASTSSAMFGNSISSGGYGLQVGATSGGLGYIQAQRADGTASVYDLTIQPNGGNVGIGTASPGALLEINQNAENIIRIRSSDGAVAGILFGDQSDLSRGSVYYDNSNESMQFRVNNQLEAMRIDSSGNLLVGSTILDQANNSNTANCGINLLESGIVSGSTNGTAVAYFNRLTSDGTLVDFRKNGTTVGSIGTEEVY